MPSLRPWKVILLTADYSDAVITCANNVASTIADLYGVTLSGTTGTVSNGNTDGYNNGNDYYEAPAASYQSPFLTLLAVVIVVFALTSIFGGIRRGFGGAGLALLRFRAGLRPGQQTAAQTSENSREHKHTWFAMLFA